MVYTYAIAADILVSGQSLSSEIVITTRVRITVMFKRWASGRASELEGRAHQPKVSCSRTLAKMLALSSSA